MGTLWLELNVAILSFTSFRPSPMPMVDLENAETAESAGNADSDLAKAEVKEHIWDSGDRIGHLGTEVWVEDSFWQDMTRENNVGKQNKEV